MVCRNIHYLRLRLPRSALLAVISMLYGDLKGARRMLPRLARPLSRNPTVWADGDASAVGFFEAFAAYFGADLQIGREARETPAP
jgi:hypothetical protein